MEVDILGMDEQNTPEVELAVSSVSHSKETESRKTKAWKFIGKNFLGLSILIAGFMVSGSVLYANNVKTKLAAQINGQQVQKPGSGAKVDVSVDDDPVLGDEKAKVTIIEFSDFQCPFCRRAAFTLKPYLKQYKNDIKFIYMNFAPWGPIYIPCGVDLR